MANDNRIVLGSGNRDEPGLYISMPGENVLTCNAGFLTFNSTNKFISTIAGNRAVVPAAPDNNLPGNVVIDTATSVDEVSFIYWGSLQNANVNPNFPASELGKKITSNVPWYDFDISDLSSGGLTGHPGLSINPRYSFNMRSRIVGGNLELTAFNGSQNTQIEIYWQLLDVKGGK